MPPHGMPPDPEGMNDQRAGWAEEALQSFMSSTRQENEIEALGDLVADILHLADRLGMDRTRLIENAQRMYIEETTP